MEPALDNLRHHRLCRRVRIVAVTLAGMCTLALGASGVATAAATRWSVRRAPQPAGAKSSRLLAVSCVAPNACTGVGSFERADRTSTLAERWNGLAWSIQHTPSPQSARHSGNILISVSCATSTGCTAVGSHTDSAGNETPLVERSTGTRWTTQAAPEPAGAQAGRLTGVSCPSPTTCTAVGFFVDREDSVLTLAERWQHGRWRIEPTPALGRQGDLVDVSCASPFSCMAVGIAPVGAERGCDYAELALAERWHRGRWSLVAAQCHQGSSAGLGGVSCASANTCMAVGGLANSAFNGPLAQEWTQGRWRDRTPASLDAPLWSVSCPTGGGCLAVVSSDIPQIERWNGLLWSAEPMPHRDIELAAVSCTTATACVAVGALRDQPVSLVSGVGTAPPPGLG